MRGKIRAKRSAKVNNVSGGQWWEDDCESDRE
jgi:hypothetical protein